MKPTIYICVVGHSGHGKSTLTEAILAELSKTGNAEKIPYKTLNKGGIDMGDGHISTVVPTHLRYETEKLTVHHIDCPGQGELIQNAFGGAAMADAAVLVVSAYDAPMPQTREHILLLRQLGVTNIIVYLNKIEKCTDDMIEMAECEVRELLLQYKLKGDSATVVRGSAAESLAASGKDTQSIPALIGIINDIPPREPHANFLGGMFVNRVFGMAKHLVACGIVRKDTIKIGTRVYVHTRGNVEQARVISIKSFKTPLEEAKDRDAVGIMLDAKSAEIGSLISTIRHTPVEKTIAEMYFFREAEGGRRTGIANGFMPVALFNSNAVAGEILLPKSIPTVMPGDNLRSVIKFNRPVYLAPGDRITLRDNNKSIGVALVSQFK